MMNILGSVNEFEVDILSERIRDVKQFKKDKMEVYTGKICYGWKRIDNKLVVDEVEYKVLEGIEFYRNNGWSYNVISKYLNKKGIRSKNGNKWYSKLYSSGKPDGEWTYYFDNGKVQMVETFRNGKKNGRWSEWYIDGNDRTHGNMKNNKMVGIFYQTYGTDKGYQNTQRLLSKVLLEFNRH
mgnify:CR=1 FL=1